MDVNKQFISLEGEFEILQKEIKGMKIDFVTKTDFEEFESRIGAIEQEVSISNTYDVELYFVRLQFDRLDFANNALCFNVFTS